MEKEQRVHLWYTNTQHFLLNGNKAVQWNLLPYDNVGERLLPTTNNQVVNPISTVLRLPQQRQHALHIGSCRWQQRTDLHIFVGLTGVAALWATDQGGDAAVDGNVTGVGHGIDPYLLLFSTYIVSIYIVSIYIVKILNKQQRFLPRRTQRAQRKTVTTKPQQCDRHFTVKRLGRIPILHACHEKCRSHFTRGLVVTKNPRKSYAVLRALCVLDGREFRLRRAVRQAHRACRGAAERFWLVQVRTTEKAARR